MQVSARARRTEPTPRREHDGETYSAATRSRSTSTQPIAARPPRPTPHGPTSPTLCDRRSLAWPIVQPVPSTLLVRPAREWRSAGYLRAPPRQWRRHAESASSGGCRPARGAVDPRPAEIARHRDGASRRAKNDQDLVPSGQGGLAGLVDEVDGDDAVRTRHDALEERRGVSVGGTVRQDASDEAVAKRPGVGGESLRRAEAVRLRRAAPFAHRARATPRDRTPSTVARRLHLARVCRSTKPCCRTI